MDIDVKGAIVLREIELAEAELAVLKQEGVLRHLVTTQNPTAEPVEQLGRLRDVVKKLSTAEAPEADGSCPGV